jgi:hypothetical protein
MRFSRFALAVLSTSALAVSAAACSDPVPPTPQGAVSSELLSKGGACTITTQDVNIGAVTVSNKEHLVVSGTDGTDIACQVSGTTSFTVSADASTGGEGVQIAIPKIDSSATKMAPAMGSASFTSLHSGGSYSSDVKTPCAFYFTQGTGQGVGSGKIWVTFSCPKVVGGMSTCEIAESFAIFETCTQ